MGNLSGPAHRLERCLGQEVAPCFAVCASMLIDLREHTTGHREVSWSGCMNGDVIPTDRPM